MDLYDVTQILCLIVASSAGLVMVATAIERDSQGKARFARTASDSDSLVFALPIYLTCSVGAFWRELIEFGTWLSKTLPNQGEQINTIYSVVLFFVFLTLMWIVGLVLLYYAQTMFINFRSRAARAKQN
jgi:hypothetical protein